MWPPLQQDGARTFRSTPPRRSDATRRRSGFGVVDLGDDLPDDRRHPLFVPKPVLDDPAALDAQFDAAHRALYGYATGEAWELASLRIEVSAPVEHPAVATEAAVPDTTPTGHRRVTFETGEGADVPILDRAALPPGLRLLGPLIVEDAWSTVIVPPQDALTADAAGNLLIEVAQ